MATESPIRISETSGKWPAPEKRAAFAPSSSTMAVEELGLLQKGHNFGRSAAPNRSGSAPPNMEGSFLAVDNVISQQNSSFSMSLANFNVNNENCSNVNLNPGLPRRLVHHLKRFGSIRELTSVDDSGNFTLPSSQVTLSTHKEESEEDRTPQRAFGEMVDGKNGFWSKKDPFKTTGPKRNLVDVIQEDFPRSSSPVYNQSRSLGYGMTEEAVEHDSDSSSLQDPSVGPSNVFTNGSADNVAVSSKADLSVVHTSSLSSSHCKGNVPSSLPTVEGTPNDADIWTKAEVLVHNINNSNINVVVSNMKDLNTSVPNLGNQKIQDPQQLHQQQLSSSSQVHSMKSQMSSQGVSGTCIGMDQFCHGPSKFSTVAQPVRQSFGLTPPLYASAAAYMTSPNPFYSDVQASGFYSPHYGVGGYMMNSSFGPPFIAGYSPPRGGIPLVFDGAAGPSFTTPSGVSTTGGSISYGADMQQYNKFYGQLGFSLQPSFANSYHLQYYQQSFGETYSIADECQPLGSTGGVFGSQNSAHHLQKGSDSGTSDDQKFRNQRGGDFRNPNSDKGSLSNYLGNPPNVGIFMQYPPITSPVLPGDLAVTGLSGGRNQVRSPPGSNRYSSWQGQRGFESYNDPKICNVLEELKSGKGRRFELSDIVGHIVQFSADQHGSRFIQQKLENCGVDEKASVFKEVLPHASTLMTDVFGNYVIQKFFDYGSSEQRRELANQLVGQVLPLSMQMYGCRVIQKALDVIELEQKAELVHELDGHVMRCVRDQNGNHVIQKCIECLPTEKIGFIISAFHGQVATLSMHPYGCRVIQRVLEHCTDKHQCQFILDEILDSVCALAQDQYGNYVTQHVLQRGKPHERSKIIRNLSGHIVQLSQHKFASNVVEKCLEYGGAAERELIIEEIVGQNEGNDNLLTMMKDQFANYVVQKIFEICTDSQQAMLLNRIKIHAHALKKYTYGKHIVARFEMLLGEENQTSES